MGLKDSKLIRNLMDGSLPSVKTDSNVKADVQVDPKSLKNIGFLVLAMGAGIAILVIVVKVVVKKIT
jgi:hypothetical protein